jgi:hypothetical protein
MFSQHIAHSNHYTQADSRLTAPQSLRAYDVTNSDTYEKFPDLSDMPITMLPEVHQPPATAIREHLHGRDMLLELEGLESCGQISFVTPVGLQGDDLGIWCKASDTAETTNALGYDFDCYSQPCCLQHRKPVSNPGATIGACSLPIGHDFGIVQC